ncbi:hypothetical protein [Amycolatopsis panacis]|uniref:Uncharacterized protein n=1 Tax=Amycolatopsis panacis TaxID=2340917 RepID=A0A419HRD2_9PSEU|nr:hypothetical protein [Amycolatopsis panacis]RJQ79135.1 hypothetical protein D5S19_26820 [Amycolatopsis panacis]
MAEQRDDRQPFDNHPTGDPAGAPANLPQPVSRAQPPAPPPPGTPETDPEQYRQFQEFQRFQEYLRFTQAQQGTEPASLADSGLVPAGSRQPQPRQAGQPPAPPGTPGELAPYEQPGRPRRAVPRWIKRLGGKILTWILALVLIGIAINWGYQKIFPSDDGKTSAQIAAEGGGTYHTNQILTTASPFESVRRVYDGIAQHGPGQRSMVDHVCGLFDQATQQKFAADLGYPSCDAAVEGLHGKLDPAPGSADAYAESISKRSGWPPGDLVTVSSCDFTITGGPALGDFTIKQVDKGQWLIVGHRAPHACPSAPSTTG